MLIFSLLEISVLFILISGYNEIPNCSETKIEDYSRPNSILITESDFGRNISILCLLKNRGGFQWMKEHRLLDRHNRKYRFHDDYLEIIRFDRNDFGAYSCIANLTGGRIISSPTHLKLRKLSTPEVTFLTPKLQMYDIGDNIIMNCSYEFDRSMISPAVKWILNGTSITQPSPCNQHNRQVASVCKVEFYQSFLVIHKASAEHQGRYQCRVTLGGVVKTSESVNIMINYQNELKSNATTLAERFVSYHKGMSLTTKIFKSLDRIGSKTQLICGLPLYEGALIQWRACGSRFPIRNFKSEGGVTENELSRTNLMELSGNSPYGCITCNYDTESEVFTKNLSLLHHKFYIYNAIRHRQNIFPKNIIPVGSRLRLKVSNSLITQAVRWYFNGKPIKNQNTFGVTLQNNHILIENASIHHQGYYQAFDNLKFKVLKMFLVQPRPFHKLSPSSLKVERIVDRGEKTVECIVSISFGNLSSDELPCHIVSCGDNRVSNFVWNPGKKSNLSIIVSRLRPYRNYTFYATYQLVSTSSIGNKFSITSTKNVTFTTNEEAPINCPLFYSTKLTPTSITIRLEPDVHKSIGGVIKSYRIYWREYLWSSDTDQNIEYITLNDTFEYTINNLKRSSFYEINVFSYNSKGQCLVARPQLFRTTSSIIKVDAFDSIFTKFINVSAVFNLNLSSSDISKIDELKIDAKLVNNVTINLTFTINNSCADENYCIINTNLVKRNYEYIRVTALKFNEPYTLTESTLHPQPYWYIFDESFALNLLCFNNNEEYVFSWTSIPQTRTATLCRKGSYYLTYSYSNNDNEIYHNIYINELIDRKAWTNKHKRVDSTIVSNLWWIRCNYDIFYYGLPIVQSNPIKGTCVKPSKKLYTTDIDLPVDIDCLQPNSELPTDLTCYFNQTDSFNVSLLEERNVHTIAMKSDYDSENRDATYTMIDIQHVSQNCSQVWFQFKYTAVTNSSTKYQMSFCPIATYCLEWSDEKFANFIDEGEIDYNCFFGLNSNYLDYY